MNSATKKAVYGFTAAVGICVTWYFNILFMIDTGGFSLTGFLAGTYANHASSSISNDLLVVVFTFLFWSRLESKRLGMRHWWLWVVLTFGTAIAFAFPLFMLVRENAIAAAARAHE